MIPSEVDEYESGLKGAVVDFSRPLPEQRRMFKSFLFQLYYRHLLVVPKDRRLLIVESLLCPTDYRNLLAAVLFEVSPCLPSTPTTDVS